ncbi:hypothetical protein F5Y05DRAFT_385302 [Hypoxylon sp. FL0543]|nr:hypothetical protein F5Y05DRAFT_385302 [Hypoxylon sp. FL0543]
MSRYNRLTRFVPRAGMMYEPVEDILGRQRADITVMDALQNARIAQVYVDATSEVKQEVDQAFADIFIAALRNNVLKHLTSQGEGVPDFLDALREAVPWLSHLNDRAIYRLCDCLVAARKKWKANPTPPFAAAQQCKTANAIDTFIERSRERLTPEFEAYFVLAGSFASTDMLPEEREEGGGQGMGIGVSHVTDRAEDDQGMDEEVEESKEAGGEFDGDFPAAFDAEFPAETLADSDDELPTARGGGSPTGSELDHVYHDYHTLSENDSEEDRVMWY